MKMITLIENELGDKEGLKIEHGLSIYIEIDGKNILFDTGKSGNFIENAKQLNIDLKQLDYVIISHGHYDHSGGFERLIKEINPDIKLYIGEGFFDKKYALRQSGKYEYIGNKFDEKYLLDNDISFEYVREDVTELTENLMIVTNFNRDEEFENTNDSLCLKDNEGYIKDMFLDEISIVIKTDKGLVVLVGCSHVGIVNILASVIDRLGMNIHALIGGTHLVYEDDEKINKIIKYFKDRDIKTIGACHCTGKQGETMLSQQLEGYFIKNNTGNIISF